jgi:hypothetical protein
MGGGANAAARPAKISALLVHARGDLGIRASKDRMTGKVFEETSDRIIVQAGWRGFFSLPRKEVEIEYIPEK